jgi:hypothetical protein
MPFIHRPAPPLGCSIELVWYNEGYPAAHRRERSLPNGRFQLIILQDVTAEVLRHFRS